MNLDKLNIIIETALIKQQNLSSWCLTMRSWKGNIVIRLYYSGHFFLKLQNWDITSSISNIATYILSKAHTP